MHTWKYFYLETGFFLTWNWLNSNDSKTNLIYGQPKTIPLDSYQAHLTYKIKREYESFKENPRISSYVYNPSTTSNPVINKHSLRNYSDWNNTIQQFIKDYNSSNENIRRKDIDDINNATLERMRELLTQTTALGTPTIPCRPSGNCQAKGVDLNSSHPFSEDNQP